jgi:trehalose/maltose transport system substrate-binding protein
VKKKMSTRKYLWSILTLLLVLSFVLVACGEATTEAPEEPEAPPAEVEEPEPEPEEPEEPTMEEITLRVFAGNVGQELELTKAAADRYMELHPNVTVEVIDTPDFVEDRLGVFLQLFEAQSPEGDVFQIDVIWPGDLAEHFVDLNEYGGAAVAGEHFPAIIQNNTVDGELIGIPWFTDAGMLYYRTDLLEKYGYDAPPANWNELEAMALAIQNGERAEGNEDFWGFVWQGNAYEGLTCDALEWVDSNGGGTIVSPDKKITINNPLAAQIIDQAAGWVGTISPAGVTGFGEEDARGVWQAGNAAFMRNWPYAFSLGQADDSVIKDMFDVSPLPAGASGAGSATLGGWQLAVSKYSEHPDIAADLAFFMASYDEQKERAIVGSFNPTIMSLYQDEDVLAASPFMGSLYDVFINAAARPSTATAPQYTPTSTFFYNAVHSVLSGEADAASALAELELDLQDLLGYEIGELGDMPEVGGGEEITIRVFAGNVGQELQLTKDAAARYMELHPNVTIEVIDTPDFVEDRLGVFLQLFEAQSSEGDVFQIDVIWPGDLAEHFVDLYEYGAAQAAAEHFPAIIQNNTVDGALIGIPWFTDAGMLYYRTDLLEKYGYSAPPATWDELEEMAQVIQDGERADGNQDFWGFVWQGNAYEGLTCDALEWIDSNDGGTIVSPDKMITIYNDAAIEAVDKAAGWVGTISPAGVTGFGEEDARGVWQAGNAAFMRNWPYAFSLGQADDSVIKDLFDVSPLPAGASGAGSATLGGWQLAVSKYSEHPDVAADLALFMSSYDEQKIRAIEGSFNPTIMSLYQDEDVLFASPFMGSLYDVFINAVARPSTATAPQYTPTSTFFYNAVHSVLMGEMDADTAFAELELDLEDLLGYEVAAP